MTSGLRHFLALCLAIGLSACTVKPLDGAIFACQDDNDCASDEVCLEKICRSPESLADGGPLTGNCAQDCSADHKMCCGTTCVDLASDDSNCGVCGKQCPSGESCMAGTCARETVCWNARDDNGDGLTDCEDETSCPDSSLCAGGGRCCGKRCMFEASDELCSNGTDDDCDGKNDCEDDTCLGRSCAAGSVCVAGGRCATGCFIDGAFVSDGTMHPSLPCLVCSAQKATHEWTPVPAGSTTSQCKGTRACNAEGHCRRAGGQACGGNGDCASGSCIASVCN